MTRIEANDKNKTYYMAFYGAMVCKHPSAHVPIYDPEKRSDDDRCPCPAPVYPPLWIIPLIVSLTFLLREIFG